MHNVYVPTATADASTQRRATSLAYLGGFFGYGLGLSALYATTGIGMPCLFRSVTGWSCPLCGGTRMGSALLHGDIASAFAYNPVALIGLCLLGLFGLARMVELLGGPATRLPARWTQRLSAVSSTRWLLLAAVVALGYTVARNTL